MVSQKELDSAALEANIQIENWHPNIVKCYEIFEGLFSNSQCLMIVLEYFPVN
jgi:hypothetical protein